MKVSTSTRLSCLDAETQRVKHDFLCPDGLVVFPKDPLATQLRADVMEDTVHEDPDAGAVPTFEQHSICKKAGMCWRGV